MGLQYVSAEDWGYMCGRRRDTHGVRSMPVEVFDFELYMQIARPVASPSGPCVTYVREDDTVETLLHRISALTGQNEWDAIRVAVVCSKRRPHYLSRAADPDLERSGADR